MTAAAPSLDDVIAEIRAEARDLTTAGEDASTLRDWANRIAKHTRAALQADPVAVPVALTAESLADALEVFWNASLQVTHQSNDPTANAVMGGMVEGFAAMACRLREKTL